MQAVTFLSLSSGITNKTEPTKRFKASTKVDILSKFIFLLFLKNKAMQQQEKTVIKVIIPFPKRDAVCKKGRNLISDMVIFTKGKAKNQREREYSKITHKAPKARAYVISELEKRFEKLKITVPIML